MVEVDSIIGNPTGGIPEPVEKKRNVRGKKMVEEPNVKYLAARYIEIVCIAVFVFGFLWNGTEVMKLTTSQFMMLYGGVGAVACEAFSRIFSKKKI
jgi:hypothetical protein